MAHAHACSEYPAFLPLSSVTRPGDKAIIWFRKAKKGRVATLVRLLTQRAIAKINPSSNTAQNKILAALLSISLLIKCQSDGVYSLMKST